HSPQGDFGTAFGVALSGDKAQKYLYVADGHNELVHILDRQTLEEVSAFGHPGHYAGQFSNIHVIGSDSKGNIYVGDGGAANVISTCPCKRTSETVRRRPPHRYCPWNRCQSHE